jgi:hypothetical protein
MQRASAATENGTEAAELWPEALPLIRLPAPSPRKDGEKFAVFPHGTQFCNVEDYFCNVEDCFSHV